eukprot:4428309-Amphidinium_carterae.1
MRHNRRFGGGRPLRLAADSQSAPESTWARTSWISASETTASSAAAGVGDRRRVGGLASGFVRWR